jgi:hypothetical protein
MVANSYFAEKEAAYRRQQMLRDAEQWRLARLATAGHQRQGPALRALLSALATRLRQRWASSPKPRTLGAPRPEAA